MATLATLEKQDVERFAHDFEKLFYQGDFSTMASYYMEDGQLMVEDREIVQGKQAIEQFWLAVCQLAGKMERIIQIDEVVATEDMGYVRSTVTTHMRIAADQVMTTSFKDITIWKRGSDGTWQLAVDIANRNPAPLKHADQAGH